MNLKSILRSTPIFLSIGCIGLFILFVAFMQFIRWNETPATKLYLKAISIPEEGGTEEEMISLLDHALELEPNNPQIRQSRGMMYFEKALYDKALVDITISTQINSSALAYNLYLRGLTLGNLGRYQEAYSDFIKAIELRPTSDQFHFGLAMAYLSMKQPELALKEINKAIELAPRYYRWKYERGLILTCLGKKDGAIEQFSKSVRYTKMLPNNIPQEIYFNGQKEYARNKDCTSSQILPHWEPSGKSVSVLSKEYKEGS